MCGFLDELTVLDRFGQPSQKHEKSTDLLPADKGVLLVVYCNGVKSGTCSKWADMAKTAGHTNIAIYSEGFRSGRRKMCLSHRSEAGFEIRRIARATDGN